MVDWKNLLFLVGLYLVLPVAAGKNMGASWKALGIAYALWTALLLVIGLALGANLDEGLGLAAILAMFFSLIAIPLILYVMRRKGWK